MNLARAIVNDMLRSKAGQILRDERPFSIEYLNASIEDLQEYLANNGISAQIIDNFILTPLTAISSPDPTLQTYVGSNGYFNGATLSPTPKLPPDLITPLRAWERLTGSGADFDDMTRPQDGLPSRRQGAALGYWEWRQDRIYMMGATESRDMRIRYQGGIVPIDDAADLSLAVIPIRAGKRALAYGVVEYYAQARGAAALPGIVAAKKEKYDELVNRAVRAEQRIGYRPQGFRGDGDNLDGSLSGDYR